MALRGIGASDARGKGAVSRIPPPPIITNGAGHFPSHQPAHSNRSSGDFTSTLSPRHLNLPSSSPLIPLSPLSSTSLSLLHSGLLKKKSPSGFSYHTRYFTLSTHFLSYFNKATDRFPLGYLALSEIVTVSSGGGSIELGLWAGGGERDRKYKLQAETREEGEVWRQKIEKAIASLHHSSSIPHLLPSYDDLSPRTPMALKRPTSAEGWKEEPSELERSFFALKFSGKRGGLLCRSCIDVRTNRDILTFLLELLVDAPELRGEGALTVGVGGHERRHSMTMSLHVPTPSPTGVSATTPLPPAHAIHARALSVGMAEVKVDDEFHRTRPPPSSTSDPTSPHALPPSDDSEAVHPSRSLNAIADLPSTPLVSYSHLVSSLSHDDKQFILSWLSTPSTLASLTSLLLIPNAFLHDRILRVLYLHCIVTVKADHPRLRRVRWGKGGDDELLDDVGNRYGLLMNAQMSNVTLPSFQLQLFQALLLMTTTPLALFPSPPSHLPHTPLPSTTPHCCVPSSPRCFTPTCTCVRRC